MKYYYVLKYLNWADVPHCVEGVITYTQPLSNMEEINGLKQDILKKVVRCDQAEPLNFIVLSRL